MTDQKLPAKTVAMRLDKANKEFLKRKCKEAFDAGQEFGYLRRELQEAEDNVMTGRLRIKNLSPLVRRLEKVYGYR